MYYKCMFQNKKILRVSECLNPFTLLPLNKNHERTVDDLDKSIIIYHKLGVLRKL